MPKMTLNCHDQLNRVQFVTKTSQDNNMIDHWGLVYVENETELSWHIELGTVYDESQIT